jgi:hypothetical protein
MGTHYVVYLVSAQYTLAVSLSSLWEKELLVHARFAAEIVKGKEAGTEKQLIYGATLFATTPIIILLILWKFLGKNFT